jgi:hypothetical protein
LGNSRLKQNTISMSAPADSAQSLTRDAVHDPTSIPKLCQEFCGALDLLYQVPDLLPETKDELIELRKTFEPVRSKFEFEYPSWIKNTLNNFNVTSERYRTLRAEKEKSMRKEYERQCSVIHFDDPAEVEREMKHYDNSPNLKRVSDI